MSGPRTLEYASRPLVQTFKRPFTDLANRSRKVGESGIRFLVSVNSVQCSRTRLAETYPPKQEQPYGEIRTGNGRGAGNSSPNFHGVAPSRVSGSFIMRARTIAIGIGPPR